MRNWCVESYNRVLGACCCSDYCVVSLLCSFANKWRIFISRDHLLPLYKVDSVKIILHRWVGCILKCLIRSRLVELFEQVRATQYCATKYRRGREGEGEGGEGDGGGGREEGGGDGLSNLSSRIARSYLTMVRFPCDHRFPGVIHFALLPAWLLVDFWHGFSLSRKE